MYWFILGLTVTFSNENPRKLVGKGIWLPETHLPTTQLSETNNESYIFQQKVLMWSMLMWYVWLHSQASLEVSVQTA